MLTFSSLIAVSLPTVRVRFSAYSNRIYGKRLQEMEKNKKILTVERQLNVINRFVQVEETTFHMETLPAYDDRIENRISVVKNQKDLGTCWAFASLTALETSLLPDEKLIFSPDHMTLQNSFHANQDEGGQYSMAMAYFTSWQGPVLEEEDPYNDGKTTQHLLAKKHVQEIQIIPDKEYEQIKRAVYEYGAVQSTLYTSLVDAESNSPYYNKSKAAYCYIGDNAANHDVVIIGWDDSYPKENFTKEAARDGAFICQNSWGTDFGEQGIFYVSYEDTNIGKTNVVYTKIENYENYDKIYQSDLCGWVGQLGYGQDSAYFANVYQADEDEYLSAAGFYATGEETQYAIYVITDFENEDSLLERTYLCSGKFQNAGYYTVPFEKNIVVKKGKKFAVIVQIQTPNSVHPVAIEYAADEFTQNVDLADGEGYISYTGQAWDSVETLQEVNLCLKVYGNDIQ